MAGWTRRRRQWGELSSSLWLLPTVFTIIALGAGWALSQITVASGTTLSSMVFQGSAADARQLLIVVASTMITVTGLVFVLTVIALQIASTQVSPRLLRSFLNDRGTQVVMGVFVATIAYSLAGLHTVGREVDGELFVPRVAVSGALLLALVSVGMLVYYIQHITNAIRIDSIMERVAKQSLAVLAEVHPRRLDPNGEAASLPQVPDGARRMESHRTGYTQGVDIDALVAAAQRRDAHVALEHPVGHHLIAGDTLGWVWGDDDDPNMRDEWSALLARFVFIEAERSGEHDYAYDLRQLVDIALRAIAPSMNDPYTSVQAIQHITAVMTDMVTRDMRPAVVADTAGAPRVMVPMTSFEENLAMVCGHIRPYAADHPRVAVELLRLLQETAARAPTARRRQAVAAQVELVVDECRREVSGSSDLDPVLQMAATALAAAGDADQPSGRA